MLAILARKYVFFRIVCSVKIAHKNEKYCQWSVVAKFKLTICSRSNTQQSNARTSPWVNSFRNKFLRNHHHWLRHIFLVHSQKSMMKYENVYMKKENTCFLCVWPLLSRLITWTKHTNLIFFFFCSVRHTDCTQLQRIWNRKQINQCVNMELGSANYRHTLFLGHIHTHTHCHICVIHSQYSQKHIRSERTFANQWRGWTQRRRFPFGTLLRFANGIEVTHTFTVRTAHARKRRRGTHTNWQ